MCRYQVIFWLYKCLFQSQLWQATSTSWSTSCPSSLRPSWTLTTGKISLIAVRSCARTGQHRPMLLLLCCTGMFSSSEQCERFIVQLSVQRGSVQRRRLRALWQWPNATNTDIKDSGPYWSPCTQSHMTKPKPAQSSVFVKQDVTEQLRVISSAC